VEAMRATNDAHRIQPRIAETLRNAAISVKLYYPIGHTGHILQRLLRINRDVEKNAATSVASIDTPILLR
jgi:hypothetical protein